MHRAVTIIMSTHKQPANQSIERVLHWSYCNGIVMGSPYSAETRMNPLSNSCIHAPFTQTAYKYPERVFRSAVSLSTLFNELVDKCAHDRVWLKKALENVGNNVSYNHQL